MPWSQIARLTIAVAQDDDTGQLVISRGKDNLGPRSPSLAARIVPHTVHTSDGETSVGRVEWLGETEHDARELLGNQVAEERSELDEAWEWLRQHLEGEGGTAAAGKVIWAAKRDGIAERILQRARKKNGVVSRKAADGWIWTVLTNGEKQDTHPDGGEKASTPGTGPAKMSRRQHS